MSSWLLIVIMSLSMWWVSDHCPIHYGIHFNVASAASLPPSLILSPPPAEECNGIDCSLSPSLLPSPTPAEDCNETHCSPEMETSDLTGGIVAAISISVVVVAIVMIAVVTLLVIFLYRRKRKK